MELRQLRYFVHIVETGSMGHVVPDFNIGVSALSQQIARLGNELAVCLLQRTSREVTPTSAGLTFYSQAQLALRHADDTILATRKVCLLDHASVGMAPSTASVLSAPFINATHESYPNMHLHLVGSLSGNLERMISTCQLDLAIVFQREKILRWSARPMLEKRLPLIGTHALLIPLQEDYISPDQPTSLPLIMPSQGHDLRGRLEAVYQQHHLSAEVVVDIDGLALLIQTVRSGLGVTLQPGAVISRLDHQTLRIVDVISPILSRPNFLVSLFDNELTPAGLAARMIFSEVMRQLAGSDRWSGAALYAHQTPPQHYTTAPHRCYHLHSHYRFNS